MSKTFTRFFCALILISAGLSAKAQNNNFEIARNTEIYMALMNELNSNYVDEISPGKLTRTALEAMLESLDPYTNYISEADVEEYRFITTGEYGGVGILTHMKGDTIVVSEIHENSPASRAGIKTGDRVLEVNGESAIGKTDENLSLIMKGEPGVEISLTLLSPGKNLKRTVTLKRENIKLGNIPYSTMLQPGIGYISLERFTQGAARDVKNAYDKLNSADTLKGLIIDLRGNGGGLLNEAVGICNLFVGKGQHIVSTKGRFQSRSQEYGTTAEASSPNLPLVILVDESSASASEIVAGALQDIDRAVIIGKKTYGKGLVQNIIPLPYNAQVKITVAKYYTPSGRCIQEIDYQHRDENGKALAVPGEKQKTFTTRGGRIVHDAGGIEPDMKVDSSSGPISLFSIITGFYLFDFATLYASDHETIPPVGDFTPDDKLFDEFVSYLKNNHYPSTAATDEYIEDFRNMISDKKTDTALLSAYNSLVGMYNQAALNDVTTNRERVKNWLRIEIASRYYGDKGRIEASLDSSPEVKLALEILNNKSDYNSILAGTNPKCLNKKP